MKFILGLSSFVLFSFSALSQVQNLRGSVREISCGHNSMVPLLGQRPGQKIPTSFVSKVCSVVVEGIDSKLPIFTFEIAGTNSQKTTYAYSVVNLKVINTTMPLQPGTPRPTDFFKIAEFEILGTVEHDQLHFLNFIRPPGKHVMRIGFDRLSNISSLTGNLPVLGNGTSVHPVQVEKFQSVK